MGESTHTVQALGTLFILLIVAVFISDLGMSGVKGAFYQRVLCPCSTELHTSS